MTTRKVTSRKDLASGKWVKLVELEYSIDQKIHNKWEMLERTTKPSNGLDGNTFDIIVDSWLGVDVLGIICTDSPKIVLVSQFRPPLDAFCLELPAGLITDYAEDPIEAGMRELRVYNGCMNLNLIAVFVGRNWILWMWRWNHSRFAVSWSGSLQL